MNSLTTLEVKPGRENPGDYCELLWVKMKYGPVGAWIMEYGITRAGAYVTMVLGRNTLLYSLQVLTPYSILRTSVLICTHYFYLMSSIYVVLLKNKYV